MIGAEFMFVLTFGFLMGAGMVLAWLHLDRLADAIRHPHLLDPPGPGIIIPLHYDDSRHVRTVPGAYDQDADA